MEAPQVSVLLCTRSADEPYLAHAIDSVLAQEVPVSAFELVVVINGTRATFETARKKPWANRCSLVHEPRRGLLWARLAGIAVCRGTYVVLMDDDARLATDYLCHVIRFFDEHPKASIIGGTVHFDVSGKEPPASLRPAFALRVVKGTSPAEPNGLKAVPAGIGMGIRREFIIQWARSVKSSPWKSQLGRVGNLDGAGEDLDMVALAHQQNGQIWFCENLKLSHWIPESRLHWRYVRKLVRTNNLARNLVLMHYGNDSVSSAEASRFHLYFMRFRSFCYALIKNWEAMVACERAIAKMLASRAVRPNRAPK